MARRKNGGMAVKRRGALGRLLLALLLCLVGLVGWSGWKGLRALLGSDLMTLSYLEVDVCRVLPEARVTEAFEELIGRPLHTLDPDSLRGVLEELPRVAEARVSRKLPGTLSIRIREAEAVALIYSDGSFEEIDAGGRVLPRFGGPPPDLPILRPNASLPLDSLTGLALTALEALRESGFDLSLEVSEIGVGPEGVDYLRSETRTRVILGWEDFVERIRSYRQVRAEIASEGFPGELDLRFRDQVVARDARKGDSHE